MKTRKSESNISPQPIERLQGKILVRKNIIEVERDNQIVFMYDEEVWEESEWQQ